MIKQKFPCSTFVKQYLLYIYDSEPNSVVLDNTTLLGSMFISRFESPDLFNSKEVQSIENLSTNILLQFNEKDLHDRILLSETSIMLLNRCIKQLALECLLQKINDYIALGLSQQDAINDFIEDLDLEENDAVFSALRQAIYRNRKKKTEKNKKLRYARKMKQYANQSNQ